MKAIVCGAGVGGLSAGLALQRAGFEVEVYEQAANLRPTGFGLNLWPASGRALTALGLEDEYRKIAVKLNRYLVLDSSGETLFEHDVSKWPESLGAPAAGVERRALTHMLANAVGMENIKFDHQVSDISWNRESVTAIFSSGTTATGDILIGADGINSRVRACTSGTFLYRDNPWHSFRWRGVVRFADTEILPDAETETYGGRSFFGTIPIDKDRAYWFASGPDINSVEELFERFSTWEGTHVPGALAATVRNEIFQTKLMDLAELPDSWVTGPIALLGDAAHPMMPDMAQGASTAFVDAQRLQEVMMGVTSPTEAREALKEYDRIQRPYAYHIVNVSQRGVFTDPEAGMRSTIPDPIARRYEDSVEGYMAGRK